MERTGRSESQVAIVVGGASAVGFAVARRLGIDGARVMLVDHDGQAGERCANELDSMDIEGRLVVGDAADPAVATFAVRSAAQIWGRIDVLVTVSPATGRHAPAWETPIEVVDRVYASNWRSVFLFCRAAIPWMSKRGYGRIVNVVPPAAQNGEAYRSPLSATTAGVVGMTKSLAKELATTGILANCAVADFSQTSAMASTVAWLASTQCTFTTGAVFEADSGDGVQ